jgi:hypothetical protein
MLVNSMRRYSVEFKEGTLGKGEAHGEGVARTFWRCCTRKSPADQAVAAQPQSEDEFQWTPSHCAASKVTWPLRREWGHTDAERSRDEHLTQSYLTAKVDSTGHLGAHR